MTQPTKSTAGGADAVHHPAHRTARRLGRSVLLYLLIPYLAVTFIFALLQRQFLYPGQRADVPITSTQRLPQSARDVTITTHDGLELKGWLVVPASSAVEMAGDSKRPRDSVEALVIFFPGNAENRWTREIDCRDFTAAGVNVLLIDYRGYGGNPGSPTETDLSEDARSIWQFAVDDLKFPPERIVLFGESLGGAVATRLASELCRGGTPPAGLVLSSTFASLPETVAWHYPYFPFRYLLLDRYPSVDRIRDVTCPIVILHGTEDDFVPLEHGRRLFNAAPAQSAAGVPKRFEVVSGSGHNSLPVSLLRAAVTGMLADSNDSPDGERMTAP